MTVAAKRIMITDNYAHNLGDVGILMAMVSDIRRRLPEAEIVVESTHPAFLKRYDLFREMDVVPRVFDIQDYDRTSSRWRTLAVAGRGLLDSALFLIWALLARCGVSADFIIRPSRRGQARLLRSSDVFVSSGGGFLSSRYNYHFRLYIQMLARLLGRPVMIYGQSIGPFETFVSRSLIPRALNKCALICVREPNTLDFLQSFHLKPRTVLTADAAFLLPAKPAPWVEEAAAGRRIVAFGLKAYGIPARRRAYIEAMAATAAGLVAGGFGVWLVPHTPESEAVAGEIAAAAGGDVGCVPFGRDPRELKALYSRCEFIVTGIMHPAIFASETGVPFVAIGYEPKFEGLVRLLGCDRRLLLDSARIGQDGFREDLAAAVRLIAAERSALSWSLLARMPEIRRLAALNTELLAELLDGPAL